MASTKNEDQAQTAETNVSESSDVEAAEATTPGESVAQAAAPGVDSQSGNASATDAGRRGNRAQKVGIVTSDKMEKSIVVRVDRLVKHPKYRRYVRRTSKFMAHDETGAGIGDKVRIVETRPLSARKRWRVVEIVQRAAK